MTIEQRYEDVLLLCEEIEYQATPGQVEELIRSLSTAIRALRPQAISDRDAEIEELAEKVWLVAPTEFDPSYAFNTAQDFIEYRDAWRKSRAAERGKPE